MLRSKTTPSIVSAYHPLNTPHPSINNCETTYRCNTFDYDSSEVEIINWEKIVESNVFTFTFFAIHFICFVYISWKNLESLNKMHIPHKKEEKYLYAYILLNFWIGLRVTNRPFSSTREENSSRSENVLVLIDKLSGNILWDRVWPRVDSRASTRNHRGVLSYIDTWNRKGGQRDRWYTRCGDVNGRGCRVTRS